MSEYYTVIRVKRKLDINDDDQNRYDSGTDVKRIRHIGSFVEKHDETSFNSQNLLTKMGFKDRKPIRFNDLNTEQFSKAYTKKSDEVSTKKFKKMDHQNESLDQNKKDDQKESEKNQDGQENDINKISLLPQELPQQQQDLKKKDDQQQITCNNDVLTPVPSTQDKYLYDYYILLDDIVDYEEDKNDEDPFEDEEPSSNDENFRYNDYPDEDEVSPPTSDCDEEKDDDNEHDPDVEDYDEYRESSYKDRFCENFDDIYLESNSNDGDDDDDDDDEDYDNELYQKRIMNLK